MNPDQRNRAFKVLLVGDANLSAAGERVLRASFADVTAMTWDIRSSRAERRAAALRARIRRESWDLCFSFYNDLVFHREDLARMRVPLNIHPATPRLPGVGYDTIPLIEGHKRIGATLHIMTPRIDSGPILDVLECDLPPSSTRSGLRTISQQLCVDLLDKTAASLRGLGDRSDLLSWIESSHASVPMAWSPDYMSRKRLRRLLDDLKARRPAHPVFQ